MKHILMGLTALLSLALTTTAGASEPTGCSMTYDVNYGMFVILGGGQGTGTVTCVGIDGTAQIMPVYIQIRSLGLGLGKFQLRGVTGEIGIQDPRDIEGLYTIFGGDAGLVLAVGGSLGFQSEVTGLSFTGEIEGGTGLGLSVRGMSWLISPYYQQQVPVVYIRKHVRHARRHRRVVTPATDVN